MSIPDSSLIDTPLTDTCLSLSGASINDIKLRYLLDITVYLTSAFSCFLLILFLNIVVPIQRVVRVDFVREKMQLSWLLLPLIKKEMRNSPRISCPITYSAAQKAAKAFLTVVR